MNNTDNSVLVTNVTTNAPSPPSGEPPPLDYHGDVRVMIWKVIPPIIISIGTFGNILTMIVLLRQIKRLSSTAIFLLALAVSDTVFLWFGPFRHWLEAIWKIDIRTSSDAFCKLHFYMTMVSINTSSWLLVAVTMERVVSVIIPHRVKLLCTPTKAGFVIVVITVLVFAIDMFVPIAFGLDSYQNNTICTPSTKEYKEFWLNYFVWIDFCVEFACPFIILLIGNIIIMVKLAKSHSKRKKMNLTHGQTKSAHKERSVSVLLVSLCFVFFITMSPVAIYHTVWYRYRIKIISAMTDPDEQLDAYTYLAYQKAVINIVSYTNASTNFLLYVFNGSKFRGELKALLYCKTSNRNGVFGSRIMPCRVVSKISSEHNQNANKSSVVNDSVSDAMQLDRNVHTNIDGQCKLVETTNERQGYLNHAFNADDVINQVRVTCEHM